ncbi:MAG TPA: alpha-amylase family glycosyl hydrolase, partial [Bacteroidota bacterium]
SDVNYVLQNLIDSHDTDRWSSMILNPNRKYDHENGLRNNRTYNVSKPGERELQILKLMALFQMTYVGAPMVYYGTESGMWGADDPDDRKPMVWDDLTYEDEQTHPFGMARSADKVSFDHSLFAYFKDLIAVRNSYRALRRGSFQTLIADSDQGLYAFDRLDSGDRVTVVLNNSSSLRVVSLRGHGTLFDVLTGREVDPSAISLKPLSGMILVSALQTSPH